MGMHCCGRSMDEHFGNDPERDYYYCTHCGDTLPRYGYIKSEGTSAFITHAPKPIETKGAPACAQEKE